MARGEGAGVFSGADVARYLAVTKSCVIRAASLGKEPEREVFMVNFARSARTLPFIDAPIFDYHGKVIAGISVAGPTLRITEKDIPKLAKLVMDTAAAISPKVGFQFGQK